MIYNDSDNIIFFDKSITFKYELCFSYTYRYSVGKYGLMHIYLYSTLIFFLIICYKNTQ